MRFTTARPASVGIALLVPALLFGLAGCGSAPPPPPPPTVVNATMTTTADVNPTAQGQGAPLVLRIYQLTSASAFEKAEFYRLYNQDSATLGADLAKKDEYLLPPGSTKSVSVQPPSTVTTLGVFAAYRDFSHANWRATVPVPPNKTTNVTIEANAKGIAVKAEPAPVKPAS